jgi:predicted regulator of Ras-like GTPase activity (Roadblock/LC7/MglB family)
MAGTGLDWLLDSFTERTAGVRHTVAVSGDGLLVAASRELPPDRAQQLAAVVAGVVSLAQGVSACVDRGPVLRTIVQMRRHLLFVISLDATTGAGQAGQGGAGGGQAGYGGAGAHRAGEAGAGLASLAALVTVGCDAGAVAYEMAILAEKAGPALTPGSR